MSWRELPQDVRSTAENVLTRKQLDVWKLWLAGCSSRRIALMLMVSRSTVRSHLEDGMIRLSQAGVRVSAEGVYYLEGVAA